MLLFARGSDVRIHKLDLFLMRLNLKCASGEYTVYSSVNGYLVHETRPELVQNRGGEGEILQP